MSHAHITLMQLGAYTPRKRPQRISDSPPGYELPPFNVIPSDSNFPEDKKGVNASLVFRSFDYLSRAVRDSLKKTRMFADGDELSVPLPAEGVPVTGKIPVEIWDYLDTQEFPYPWATLSNYRKLVVDLELSKLSEQDFPVTIDGVELTIVDGADQSWRKGPVVVPAGQEDTVITELTYEDYIAGVRPQLIGEVFPWYSEDKQFTSGQIKLLAKGNGKDLELNFMFRLEVCRVVTMWRLLEGPYVTLRAALDNPFYAEYYEEYLAGLPSIVAPSFKQLWDGPDGRSRLLEIANPHVFTYSNEYSETTLSIGSSMTESLQSSGFTNNFRDISMLCWDALNGRKDVRRSVEVKYFHDPDESYVEVTEYTHGVSTPPDVDETTPSSWRCHHEKEVQIGDVKSKQFIYEWRGPFRGSTLTTNSKTGENKTEPASGFSSQLLAQDDTAPHQGSTRGFSCFTTPILGHVEEQVQDIDPGKPTWVDTDIARPPQGYVTEFELEVDPEIYDILDGAPEIYDGVTGERYLPVDVLGEFIAKHALGSKLGGSYLQNTIDLPTGTWEGIRQGRNWDQADFVHFPTDLTGRVKIQVQPTDWERIKGGGQVVMGVTTTVNGLVSAAQIVGAISTYGMAALGSPVVLLGAVMSGLKIFRGIEQISGGIDNAMGKPREYIYSVRDPKSLERLYQKFPEYRPGGSTPLQPQ